MFIRMIHMKTGSVIQTNLGRLLLNCIKPCIVPVLVAGTVIIAGCSTSTQTQDRKTTAAAPAEVKSVVKPEVKETAKKTEVKSPAWTATDYLRIDCGSGEDYKDAKGNIWKADRSFEKGGWGYEDVGPLGYIPVGVVDRGQQVVIEKTDIPRIYQTELYGLARYRITVLDKGKYTVKLHFAETYPEIKSAGDRIYSVSVEDKPVATNMDIFKEAGPGTALVKTVETEVADGEITIDFKADTQQPLINAIEVIAPTASIAAEKAK